MICYISKYAGFCFGVSLAVNSAYENVQNGTCMLGEIVHNPTVMTDLKNRGMRMVESVEEIKPGESALIRAHGVPEDVILRLNHLSVPIIDRTCPKVKKIHVIVRKACAEGKRIVIVGNANHPEVIGIIGWCDKSEVIQNESDAFNLINDPANRQDEICLVSQTTFNKKKYESIRDLLINGGLRVDYHDTICLDTSNRQREVSLYADKVDCVVVVGGINSSNSTKLYEIAKESCKKAIHVQSAADMDVKDVIDSDAVFVTGGASTPVENVTLAVETIKRVCLENGILFETAS